MGPGRQGLWRPAELIRRVSSKMSGGFSIHCVDVASGRVAAGTAAARALNMLRGGTELPAVIYPRKAELKVNAALAGKCRWPFSLD